MDCGPPGSSVHGNLQARTLAWDAVLFSRDLPHPGIKPRSPWLMLSKCLLSTWVYVKLLVNVASPLFSCVAGPEEEEEV